MKRRYAGRRKRRPVNHTWIAELCCRHRSGDCVEVAKRYVAQQGLTELDLLRVCALMKRTRVRYGAMEE